MRSVKEIKDRKGHAVNAKQITHIFNKMQEDLLSWVLEGEHRYTLKEFEEEGLILPLKNIKQGTKAMKYYLKHIKEPRYTQDEIHNLMVYYMSKVEETTRISGYGFVDFLKDTKKVKRILEAVSK